MQQQVNAARVALRRNRGKVIAFLSGVGLLIACAGAALALALDRAFR